MDFSQIAIFIVFTFIGYLFFYLVAGKHECDKAKYEFKLSIGKYYVHLHHWIWGAVILVFILAYTKLQYPWALGLLVGTILQGLHYRDRFVIVYRKNKEKKICSELRRL